MTLDRNCPLRVWARPFGGDKLSDDVLEKIWKKTLDRVEFQKTVSNHSLSETKIDGDE